MLRNALVSASALVCLAPAALAADPTPAPDYDFTMAFKSRSTDVALGFEFRATERLAWGFDVGASFVDDVGLSLGLDLKYFAAEDFRGFYVGVGAAFAALDQTVEDDINSSSHIGFNFGHKWLIDPGFTVDVGVGMGLSYAEQIDSATDATVVIEQLQPSLIANLAVGWSF